MKFFAQLSLLSLLITPFSVYCQKYQIGLSAGPALLYVVEDAYNPTDYFYGMAYQNEFIFLDKENQPNFGFNLTSSGAEKTNGYYYNYGRINNTSIMASKYFSHQFFDFLSGSLELGTGLNFEYYSSYSDINRSMLNLQIGGRLQAEILPNFFVHAKGLAVGQDVTNIIRGFSTGDWVTSAEDIHLMLFFGLATNFGSRDE